MDTTTTTAPTSQALEEPTYRRSVTALIAITYWVLSLLTVAFGLSALVIMGGVVTKQWQADSVLTGSMEPNIPTRSLILATEQPTDELKVGQVIMITAPDNPGIQVVHRIIKVGTDKNTGFVTVNTQGDANPTPDSWTASIPDETAWVVKHHVPLVGMVVTNPMASAAMFFALLLGVLGTSVLLSERRTPAP
jgi:signal peptidase I